MVLPAQRETMTDLVGLGVPPGYVAILFGCSTRTVMRAAGSRLVRVKKAKTLTSEDCERITLLMQGGFSVPAILREFPNAHRGQFMEFLFAGEQPDGGQSAVYTCRSCGKDRIETTAYAGKCPDCVEDDRARRRLMAECL